MTTMQAPPRPPGPAAAPAGRRRPLVLAGLLVAALIGLGAVLVLRPWRPDPPSTVTIVMHHSRFVPGVVEARPGQAITFVVRNDDPIDHELIMGPEDVQRRHEAGREREHHGDVPGEVSVPAGSERRTTYRFTAPGSVPYACHLPGHFAYGMRGDVVVG